MPRGPAACAERGSVAARPAPGCGPPSPPTQQQEQQGGVQVEQHTSSRRERGASIAQHEAELRLLRRAREENGEEIANLRRAVGTASFERDAANKQLAQREEGARRSEETLQRQCAVRVLRSMPGGSANRRSKAKQIAGRWWGARIR